MNQARRKIRSRTPIVASAIAAAWGFDWLAGWSKGPITRHDVIRVVSILAVSLIADLWSLQSDRWRSQPSQ